MKTPGATDKEVMLGVSDTAVGIGGIVAGVDGVCGVLGALIVEVAGAETVFLLPFPRFWGGNISNS